MAQSGLTTTTESLTTELGATTLDVQKPLLEESDSGQLFSPASAMMQMLESSESDLSGDLSANTLTKADYQGRTFQTQNGATIYYTWQDPTLHKGMEEAGNWDEAQKAFYSQDHSLGPGIYVSTNPYDSAHYGIKHHNGTALYEIIVEPSKEKFVLNVGAEETWRAIDPSTVQSIKFRPFTGEGMTPDQINSLSQDVEHYAELSDVQVSKTKPATEYISSRIEELKLEAQEHGVELGDRTHVYEQEKADKKKAMLDMFASLRAPIESSSKPRTPNLFPAFSGPTLGGRRGSFG